MRWLIVSTDFFPRNSPRSHRATEVAKELCRQGHDVSVLTPADSRQVELAEEFGIKFIDLGRSRWPQVNSQPGRRFHLLRRLLKRVLLQGFDYPTIEWKFRVQDKLKHLPRHDVLLSIAHPHSVNWGIAAAHKRGDIPADTWIADCGDPYMGRENSRIKPLPYFKPLEASFCDRADFISVPISAAIEAYYPEYRHKISVIPQGFRFKDYDFPKKSIQNSGGIVRFAFAGAFIAGFRDPRPFVKFIGKGSTKFEFHVFSRTADTILGNLAKDDSRIILHGFCPRNEVLVLLAQMDFLLNIRNEGAKQAPSKLIDYHLAGRPILDIPSIGFDQKLIEQFLDGDYSNGHKIENPTQYEIKNVVHEFVELVHADREG